MAGRWHQRGIDQALEELNSSREGLSSAEAKQRLERYGPNLLKENDRSSLWPILFRQFTDVMILILLVAAGIAWYMRDLTDTVMILVIVILNASLGFSQEHRAERALKALRRLERRHVTVRRDGEPLLIPASDLVPGDMMALEAGQRVPADGRLIEATRLKMDESHLTGESLGVDKQTRTLPREQLAIGDRTNMAYMGTTVVTGHGWAAVTETGMRTELGKVAHLLREVVDSKTPLQLRLAYLGKWLAAAALAMTGVIFGAGLLRGESLEMMLLTSISIAVAVIPEGLPAMVTISLALGAQRMARRNALIRKLPAVETLGSVTTICSDKTGTLTQNVMSVEIIYCEKRLINVTGNGYLPKGRFYEKDKEISILTDAEVVRLLRAAALCTNASLREEDGRWTVLGDPTEGALLAAAAKAGLRKEKLEEEFPRIREIPFDSVRKLMTTLHRDPEGRVWAFTKGSIEEVLRRSTAVAEEKSIVPFTRHRRDEVLRIHRELAGDGVRVLACAMRQLESAPSDDDFKGIEENLTFLGLFGMLDPPRAEAKEAVARCYGAGIRPVMITGDHRITAEAIASDLGIKRPEHFVLTGEDLESMPAEEVESRIPGVSVYARVSPEQKVRIVQGLKRHGEIVAMTGDGVNDAPALRASDIGVAMGRGGTDVAREAADMVLLDDNFATIVSAVEEGRVIYDNIRKFTRYMLVHNSGEILTMFFAILFGLPLPLLPIQILWMNLVTDGLPALALAVEPAERNIMERPPRNPKESLFAGGMGLQIIWIGLLISLGAIVVFRLDYQDNGLAHGRTMVFFTLTAFQMFNVLAMRSERYPLWKIGFFSNPMLMGAVLLTIVLQLAILYNPFLARIFHTTPLTGRDLGICFAVASTAYFAVEAEKWLRYRRNGMDRKIIAPA